MLTYCKYIHICIRVHIFLYMPVGDKKNELGKIAVFRRFSNGANRMTRQIFDEVTQRSKYVQMNIYTYVGIY